MTPFCSIIITTHLRPTLLARALGSLGAQTMRDFEIIVVSDAPCADTAATCAAHLRPCDQFLRRAGQPGPAASRNAALALARGAWVTFLDDDDTLEPHRLAALAEGAAGADIVFTDCAVVTEDRRQCEPTALTREALALGALDASGLWLRNAIPNHALAFRRPVIEGLAFDTHMASLEDWEFLMAAMQRATPIWRRGGGVVMHKDYVTPGARRGTSAEAKDQTVILDYLYAYRRRPAPTPALREARQRLLAGVGLDLPLAWF